MTLMILPDFLARQLAVYAIRFRYDLAAIRSVPGLLSESGTSPSDVSHDNAAPAR
jgi:hypothetical protein